MLKTILSLSAVFILLLLPNANSIACNGLGLNEPAGETFPSLAYDAFNNRFLMVFNKCTDTRPEIYGQLITYDGSSYDRAFRISGASYPYSAVDHTPPSAAFDTVNRKFLVVWADDRNDPGGNYDIYGQLVKADGTLSGDNFSISSAYENQDDPKTAYDSNSNKFLVVWDDYRSGSDYDIYGRLVNADGSLNGSGFVVSDAVNDQYTASLDYNPANESFLVVWSDGRDGNHHIYGQRVTANGSFSGDNFAISNGPDGEYGPTVAYDSIKDKFLVAWYDFRNSCEDTLTFCVNADVYGRIVNADGSLHETDFVISTGAGEYPIYNPAASYDSSGHEFLVLWYGHNYPSDIYGQTVGYDGTAGESDIVISNAEGAQYSPSISYNSVCGNYLAAFHTEDTPEAAISLMSVGSCDKLPPVEFPEEPE